MTAVQPQPDIDRGSYITVAAFGLNQEQADALFDRVADAAHALDEEVTCYTVDADTEERLTAERDAARNLAAALEQEGALKDEALAELRGLHGPKRIYDECGHRHTTEEFDALNLVDVDLIGYVCEDGLLYVICGECCTDENGDQLAECADNHAHTDGEPVCDTARILSALAARLDARLHGDEEGEAS